MRILIFIFLEILFLHCKAGSVELVMWHSLAGHQGEEVKELAQDFNKSQDKFLLKLVYKGEYTETLTSFAAAFRAKQPPAIVQIFEVGTAAMLHPKGIIKPVDELMQEQGKSLPKENFLPAVREYYSENNSLLAMPFNTSIPVIYYNADVLEKLGYSDQSFPKTWKEMEILASKLKQAGFPCAYTTAYPGWIQIESFAAIHGLTQAKATQAIIKHLERLKLWQKTHYFEYGGRASNATVLFTSGRCALFSQSSGSYAGLTQLVKFRVGVAALPLDEQVSKLRYNNIAGGAALWAVAGQKPIVYQGIATFFAYLSQPQIQQRWHQKTGYLPLGTTGIYKSLAEQSNPILSLARSELSGRQHDKPRLDFNPEHQIRIINDEAFESIFAGIKTPRKAMSDAVKKSDYASLRFERNTSN